MRGHRCLPILVAILSLSSQSSALAGRVDLVLPQEAWAPGEPVTLAMENNTDHDIYIPTWPNWWHVATYPDGVLVAGCGGGLPDLWPIHPGGSEPISWGQIDCATQLPVAEGQYRIFVTYWDPEAGGPGLQIVQKLFCIDQDPCETTPTAVGNGIETSTWGRLKVTWR